MTHDMAMERFAFNDNLAAYVEYMASVHHTHVGTHTGGNRCDFTTMEGPAFVRIVRTDMGSRVCVGFVRKADGAILYNAGWKKPFIAKAGPTSPATVRGSIYDRGTWAAATGPWGVKTIR